MNKYRRWTSAEDKLLLELRNSKTNKELGAIFNRRPDKITRRLQRLGRLKSKEAISNNLSVALKAKFERGELSHSGSNNPRYKDGRTTERLYTIWLGIKHRCYNPKNKQYKDYGGRGIKMCDEWLNDYPAFKAYLGERPSLKHTLDRIDNDGNYEPDNVRWATHIEQNQNKRLPSGYNLHGEIKDGSQYCKK